MDLDQRRACLAASHDFIATQLAPVPTVAIVAGTGLGDLGKDIDTEKALPYEQVPHFPVSTATGHRGRLLAGDLKGTRVVLFQGRFHLYEGYSAWEATFPLRVLLRAGVRTVILTNAAGGLDLSFRIGDLMLIEDHMNMTGQNPLVGPHDPAWGPRFPDMSQPYDKDLMALARLVAGDAGITLREGVYVQVKGPSLETRAETRFYRRAGADAIGMSTVPEATVCAQSGARALGISVITNVNDPDDMAATSADEIVDAAERSSRQLTALVAGVIERMSGNEGNER